MAVKAKHNDTAVLQDLVLMLSRQLDSLVLKINTEFTIVEVQGSVEALFNLSPESFLAVNLHTIAKESGKLQPLRKVATAILKAYEHQKSPSFIIQETISTALGTRELQWVIMPSEDQIYIIAIDKKITNQRDELAKKLLYLEKIIDNVPHFLFWKDKDSIFLGCNDRFAKSANLASSAEIVGKSDYDLPWTEEESLAYVKADQEILSSGKAKINIEETQTINGEEVTLLTSKVPIHEKDGAIMGVLGIYTNITERKRAEEELRIAIQKAEVANHAKTNFLAKVSHELRTPLNGILGTTQILRNKEYDAELKGHIKDIEFSTAHLLNLVNDILDFSCFEEGQIIVRAEPVNLPEVVKAVIENAMHRPRSEKLKIIEKIDPKIPPLLIGDAFRIKQVLLNLVNNAIKFTPEGRITVSATCLKRNETKAKVRISVEDTGIGIPEAMQDKIFERFFQVDAGYARRHDGVGLGLAISQQIALALGSKIFVKSGSDQGALFWLDLEMEVLVLPEDNAYHKYFEGAFDENNNLYDEFFNTYVLIVEDNLLNQKIIGSMLTELGCQVEIASDGKEALALAKKNKYQLIFMDVGLPQMDGLEVTGELRKIPMHHATPIVAITAHAFENDIRRCREATMNDVLIKPIAISGLKNILTVWGSKV